MTGFTALHSQLGSPDLLFLFIQRRHRPLSKTPCRARGGADALIFSACCSGPGASLHFIGPLCTQALQIHYASQHKSSAEGYVGHTPLGSCTKSCGAGAALLCLPVLAPPDLRRVGQVAGAMVMGGQGFLKGLRPCAHGHGGTQFDGSSATRHEAFTVAARSIYGGCALRKGLALHGSIWACGRVAEGCSVACPPSGRLKVGKPMTCCACARCLRSSSAAGHATLRRWGLRVPLASGRGFHTHIPEAQHSCACARQAVCARVPFDTPHPMLPLCACAEAAEAWTCVCARPAPV